MCPHAQDANAGEPGCGSGQPSPESGRSKSLLVVRSERLLSHQQRDMLAQALTPAAQRIGAAVLVDGGLQAQVHRDIGPLVEAMWAQIEAITQLVQQNAALMQAMADSEPDSDAEPTHYLSGRPRRST